MRGTLNWQTLRGKQAPATIEADDSIAKLEHILTDAVDEVITDLKADLQTLSEELASLAQEAEQNLS